MNQRVRGQLQVVHGISHMMQPALTLVELSKDSPEWNNQFKQAECRTGVFRINAGRTQEDALGLEFFHVVSQKDLQTQGLDCCVKGTFVGYDPADMMLPANGDGKRSVLHQPVSFSTGPRIGLPSWKTRRSKMMMNSISVL